MLMIQVGLILCSLRGKAITAYPPEDGLTALY